jgi:hypothetical protein
MDEFGATLGDKIGAVFVPQALYVGDVAQEHRALPARIDPARTRNRVLLDLLEELRDAAMGSVFVVIRPIRRENLVDLAAEQEIEFLTEEAVNSATLKPAWPCWNVICARAGMTPGPFPRRTLLKPSRNNDLSSSMTR